MADKIDISGLTLDQLKMLLEKSGARESAIAKIEKRIVDGDIPTGAGVDLFALVAQLIMEIGT